MSLIVGIICKDAILLASETQTTAGDYRVLDTRKIHSIEFKNGQVLIAESGIADLAATVIDRIKNDAPKIEIIDRDTIPKFISGKVRDLYSEIVSLHPNATPEVWQEYFFSDANRFNLMVAFYDGEKPQIYNIEPARVVGFPLIGKHYSASGVGSELGNYLLREHSLSKMEYWQAAFVASHVIETVKDNVEGCGGRSEIAVLRSVPMMDEYPVSVLDTAFFANESVRFEGMCAYFLSDAFIKQMAEANSALNRDLKFKRAQEVVKILFKEAERISRPILEELDKLFLKWKQEGFGQTKKQ